MRPSNLLPLIVIAATASAVAAQTKGFEQWVGVWQGELDGQPGVTVNTQTRRRGASRNNRFQRGVARGVERRMLSATMRMRSPMCGSTTIRLPFR
jgi:hypothetical protein